MQRKCWRRHCYWEGSIAKVAVISERLLQIQISLTSSPFLPTFYRAYVILIVTCFKTCVESFTDHTTGFPRINYLFSVILLRARFLWPLFTIEDGFIAKLKVSLCCLLDTQKRFCHLNWVKDIKQTIKYPKT